MGQCTIHGSGLFPASVQNNNKSAGSLGAMTSKPMWPTSMISFVSDSHLNENVTAQENFNRNRDMLSSGGDGDNVNRNGDYENGKDTFFGCLPYEIRYK